MDIEVIKLDILKYNITVLPYYLKYSLSQGWNKPLDSLETLALHNYPNFAWGLQLYLTKLKIDLYINFSLPNIKVPSKEQDT